MADFYWRQGDTASDFTQTLRDENNDPVDIAGATIHLTMTPIRGGTAVIDTDITNAQNSDGSDGTKGTVSYTPTSDDTATSGDYLASILVTYSGGAVQTFPNAGYILISITPTQPGAQTSRTSIYRYLTPDQLKNSINLQGTNYADADIDVAIEAASRGLEYAFGGPWVLGASDEVRYVTPTTRRAVYVYPLISATSVEVDAEWAGTWDTTLTTDEYRLEPSTHGLTTAAGNGEPFHQLVLMRGYHLHGMRGTDAVKITGQWGWESVPAAVTSATAIIAGRLIRRTREAPFGIVAVGLEGAAIRAGQIANDPEVGFAMSVVSSRYPVIA